MATTPISPSDTKAVLLSIINQMEGSSITTADVDFGLPQRAVGALPVRNTKILITPKSNSGYYGIKTLWYNRIHISEMGTISINKGTATTVSQLLPAINSKYGISLTAGDIVDEALSPAQTGEIIVYLNINPNSLMFYGGAIIATQGFTPGVPSTSLVPAVWDPIVKSSLITIGPENYEISASAGVSMIRSNTSFTTGKRYFEITNNSVNGLIGFGLPTASTAVLLGSDANSWAIDTFVGLVTHNGATVLDLSSQVALMEDNPIGFMLDLDLKTLTLVLTGNVRVDITGITIPNQPIFIFAGNKSTTGQVTNIEANFGSSAFTFAVPFEYYPGFGSGGSVVSPTAGTLLSQTCVGMDMVGTYANGNGGTYTTVVEANSTACGYVPTTTLPPTTTAPPTTTTPVSTTTAPPTTTPVPTTTAPPTTTLPPTTTAPVVLPTITNSVVVSGSSTYILPIGTFQVTLIGAGDVGQDEVTETITSDILLYLTSNSAAVHDVFIAVANSDDGLGAMRIKNTGEIEIISSGSNWTSASGNVGIVTPGVREAEENTFYNSSLFFANGHYYFFNDAGNYWRINETGNTLEPIDSISWLNGNGKVLKVLYGNGKYVIVTEVYNSSSLVLAISTDGINFTQINFADFGPDYDFGIMDLDFNGNLFAGIYGDSTSGTVVVTTTDFVSISKNTLPSFSDINARANKITSIDGLFITSGNYPGTSGEYYTSPEGENWTIRIAPFTITNEHSFNKINHILLPYKAWPLYERNVFDSTINYTTNNGIDWSRITVAGDPTYLNTISLPLPYYFDNYIRCLPFTDAQSSDNYGDFNYTGTTVYSGDIVVLEPSIIGESTEVSLLGTTYEYLGSNDSTTPTPVQDIIDVDPLISNTVTYNVPSQGSLTISYTRNEHTATLNANAANALISNINEGDSALLVFELDHFLDRDVNFVFNLDYETSTAIDFTSIQYSIGSGVYINIADGDLITLPMGESLINIYIVTSTDSLIDGDTTFSFSLTKEVGTVVVLNTTSLTKSLTIIDTTTPSTTTITLDTTTATVDEGGIAMASYALTPSINENVLIEAYIVNNTTTDMDYGILQYQIGTDAWTDMPVSNLLIVPANTTTFNLRTTLVEDFQTEGNETFDIYLSKQLSSTNVSNTTALIKTFTINDTSLTPVLQVGSVELNTTVSNAIPGSVYTFDIFIRDAEVGQDYSIDWYTKLQSDTVYTLNGSIPGTIFRDFVNPDIVTVPTLEKTFTATTALIEYHTLDIFQQNNDAVGIYDVYFEVYKTAEPTIRKASNVATFDFQHSGPMEVALGNSISTVLPGVSQEIIVSMTNVVANRDYRVDWYVKLQGETVFTLNSLIPGVRIYNQVYNDVTATVDEIDGYVTDFNRSYYGTTTVNTLFENISSLSDGIVEFYVEVYDLNESALVYTSINNVQSLFAQTV